MLELHTPMVVVESRNLKARDEEMISGQAKLHYFQKISLTTSGPKARAEFI